MKKGIHDIRKNIADRKRKRVQGSHQESKPRAFLLPQDEEMHGFPPLITQRDVNKNESQRPNGTRYIGWQIAFAILLFAVVAVGKNTEVALLDRSEEWVVSNLQEDFPFAKVTAWYSDRFGDPLHVLSDEPAEITNLAMPVNGTVTTPFQNNKKGIVMSAENGSSIHAVRTGTVVFAGKDDETEQTIILQHEDGSKSVYGFISDMNVHLYEHVEAQEKIGSVSDEEGNSAQFFFAIEKNEKYVDPVKVIKVDESF